MSRPIAGSKYTVVVGDSLSSISATVYGDASRWNLIYQANQTVLRSSDPTLIYPGEVITIPELPEIKKLRDGLAGVRSRDPEKMVIELGGYELPVQSASIIRTMDTVADAWSANIAWIPGADPILDKITAPYSYTPAKAYIGNTKLVDGKLYQVGQTLTVSGRSKGLTGFSHTADLVDSNLKPPYEKENVTIFQRAKDLVSPLGISIVLDAGTEVGGKFDRVTASATDKIFEHLNKLAHQRSLLLSSTVDGDFLITKANTDSIPVADIAEGQQGETEFTANFDGRARFNTYKVLAQTADKTTEISAVAKDDQVPGSRFLTFSANDVTKGEVRKIAEWERSKRLVNALTIPFPVTSWYTPDGELWRENTLVSVTSETIGAPNGFTFLIRSVKYNFENGGRTSVLSLVPPQVYTGEKLIEPWVV